MSKQLTKIDSLAPELSAVAASAEAGVLNDFYNRVIDPNTPDEFRLKYGQAVLEYRAKLLKAIPSSLAFNLPDTPNNLVATLLDPDDMSKITSRMTEYSRPKDQHSQPHLPPVLVPVTAKPTGTGTGSKKQSKQPRGNKHG